MLSIFKFFENDKLILQETLVDKIFQLIDTNLLNYEDITDKHLLNFINHMEFKFKIYIEFILDNTTYVYGKFIRPNIIVVVCPKDKHNFDKMDKKEIIYVILHEMSHFYTDRDMPEFYYVKNKPRYNQIVSPLVESIPWNEPDNNKIMEVLDYYYQLRELPNFAFSIAFSILNRGLIPNQIFEKNKNIIQNSSLKDIDIYFWNFNDTSLQILFQLQYYTYKIRKSHYQTKLMDIQKLINKYYKRLHMYFPGGVFNDIFSKR